MVDDASGPGTRLRRWLAPGGGIGTPATVLVGLVAGAVIGFTAVGLTVSDFPESATLLTGVVVWLGATVHLVQRESVYGAIRDACYLLAVEVLAFPIATRRAIDEPAGLLFSGLVFALVALGVYSVGSWADSRRPESADGDDTGGEANDGDTDDEDGTGGGTDASPDAW